jgi:peptidoglycan biosynthesis protein MviN/MurJ (putative lipid II flippase)
MDRKSNIFATELWPKKHDWILSAFAAPGAIAVGLLAIPYWRLSLIMLVAASGGLTHVDRRFSGRPFVPMFVLDAVVILTLCFFLLVRTGHIAEDSVIMRPTAFGWLGIIVVQCAAVVHSVIRYTCSKKGADSDSQ